jgi:S1-C subfamily serine protease
VNEHPDWEIPAQAQPKASDVAYDLERALGAVLSLRAEIPEDSFTAPILGTERAGNAVLIRADGLVATIGYLITEAERIWLSTGRTAVQAMPVAYDFTSGFGLVQALGRLGVEPLPLGSSQELHVGDALVIAGIGGRSGALSARLIAKREFAGYWEYLLDEALFTIPAHPHWGGAACIDSEGRLVGIASLLVQDATVAGHAVAGNMIVPIDLLTAALPELEAFGKPTAPPRPWLGAYLADTPAGVAVSGLAPRGPAARAGLQQGDLIVELGGVPIGDLADLYRQLWSQGSAGVTVPLALLRDGRRRDLKVTTGDRDAMLRHPPRH